MRRRSLLAGGGVGLVGAALAAPAIAQSQPEIKWRMATSWPKSLDTIYGGAEYLAKRVAEMTDNKFQIRAFAGGEIVPALQVLDAVQNNTVEMGHTASYYFVGKDPTFGIDCTIPFGMNARQQNAWMTHGGGLDLLRNFFKVAKYYDTPGWWEGQAQLSAYINLGEWQKLPKSYQAILTAACADAEGWMIGKYDTDNVAAMRRLIAGGAQLRSFSKEILDACYKATQEVYAEYSANNPKWKAIYEPWRKFLDDEHQWFRVVEQPFDN